MTLQMDGWTKSEGIKNTPFPKVIIRFSSTFSRVQLFNDKNDREM